MRGVDAVLDPGQAGVGPHGQCAYSMPALRERRGQMLELAGEILVDKEDAHDRILTLRAGESGGNHEICGRQIGRGHAVEFNFCEGYKRLFPERAIGVIRQYTGRTVIQNVSITSC
jgi:hypothetical protein